MSAKRAAAKAVVKTAAKWVFAGMAMVTLARAVTVPTMTCLIGVMFVAVPTVSYLAFYAATRGGR